MIIKKACILILFIIIVVLFLACCGDLPEPADLPDQTPENTITPTKSQLENTPVITESEGHHAPPTSHLKIISTTTPAVSDTPIESSVHTNSSFLPLPILSPGQPVTISYINMIDAIIGWAIGGEQDPGDRLLRTRDGGLTWQDISPPYLSADETVQGKIKNAFFQDSTSAWVAVYYLPQSDPPEGFQQYLAIWRTKNGGLNWEVSDPIELDIALIGPVDSQIFDPSPPPLLQFLGADHGWILIRDSRPGRFKYFAWMYTTRDGGQQWKKVFDPESDLLQMGIKTGMTFIDDETGWSTTELEPVGIPFFRHTSDGGNSWGEIWLPPPEFDPDLVEYPSWCGNQHSPHLFSPTFGMLVVDCMIPEGTVQPTDILYTTTDSGRNWRANPYPG